MKKDPSGYVAITSVIILSVILLLLTVSANYLIFLNRFSVLDNENKEQSLNLAESCLEMAVLKLRTKTEYLPVAGGERLRVTKTGTCLIAKIEDFISQKKILTQGEFGDSFTNLIIFLDSEDFSVKHISECPKFTAPDFNDTCF